MQTDAEKYIAELEEENFRLKERVRELDPFHFQLSVSLEWNIDDPDCVWPDGDDPALPQPEDILRQIEKCGGILNIIREWNLGDLLQVTVRKAEA